MDLSKILGPDRPMQADKLLGPSPVILGITGFLKPFVLVRRTGDRLSEPEVFETTFDRVKRHSEPGCCRKDDERRAEAARKRIAGLAKGEPIGG